MKTTISILLKGKALLSGLVLTGMFLLISATTTSAQQSAGGGVNPYTHTAEKMSVTAYPIGTFERGHSMSVLENIATGLRQTVSNGGGTSYQKLKYKFVVAVLSEVSTKYVATEIALLTSLSGLNEGKSKPGNQQSQLQNLYNEVVSQLQ